VPRGETDPERMRRQRAAHWADVVARSMGWQGFTVGWDGPRGERALFVRYRDRAGVGRWVGEAEVRRWGEELEAGAPLLGGTPVIN
jgi:hypothetical protein